jgi:hypothetical protein
MDIGGVSMRTVLVLATLVIAVAWLPSSSHGAPTIVNDLAFVENRPPDDIFSVTGLKLQLDINTTDPGGSAASDIGHDLDKLEVIPFPTGLHTSNLSTTPVFSFTDPNPTPGISELARRHDMFIFDGITRQAIFEFAPTNGGVLSTTPSFTVPAGLLLSGHPYFFRANSIDVDLTETSSTLHARWESRSAEYLSFTPLSVPEPSSFVLIGSVAFMDIRGGHHA